MKTEQYTFTYNIFDDISELEDADRELLETARKTTVNAYVPYSNFQVGAAAVLENGSRLEGTNQENASFPVSLCAERVLLSAISATEPGVAIKTMAVSYNNLNGESIKPVSPCGMCRQAIAEYEDRFQKPIRLILGGMNGKVFVLDRATMLLPLGFNSSDLNNKDSK